MYAVQKDVWHLTGFDKTIVEQLLRWSNNLFNVGTYESRQRYFENKSAVKYLDLYRIAKTNENYGLLYSQVAQQSIKSVAESFNSFRALEKLAYKGELNQKPRLPKYRTKGGMYQISYPGQALKVVGNKVRLPLGNKGKEHFGTDALWVPLPERIKDCQIKELRLIPRNGEVWVEYIHKSFTKQAPSCSLEVTGILGIDRGINNWLTCVSSNGKPFIIDGRKLKSWNQWFNKEKARIESEHAKYKMPKGFSSKRLQQLSETRTRRMRDAVNKAVRTIVDYCENHQINVMIFGWNKGQKQEVNMGGKTNQNFVQIPTSKVKERLAQECNLRGWRFVDQDESYTSKASFLDRDFLPVKVGEKPNNWQPSGKRIKRGLYRSSAGWLINADTNGAANIIRKAKVATDSFVERVGSGLLTNPLRIKLWADSSPKVCP
ncbi:MULTISPECIES: RNA-guided endonuclease InsQ/TnpB family protein [Kamptonema]|uniref:RNA-guided endonuclease InsQ/TnpB family protein n=1 Tax=Kamptonema TaxID=1501433 RepID=UPI0001DAD5FB|nr:MULTISPECIES: RNA-guided endonuclease TnpB family protein [Kamptonema]CBN55910.1 transposase [Kamptonema sp. PCC 6506]